MLTPNNKRNFRRIKLTTKHFVFLKLPECSRDTLGSVHQASIGCCCTRHCSSPSFQSLHCQFSQWRLDLTLVILICQLILSILPASAPCCQMTDPDYPRSPLPAAPCTAHSGRGSQTESQSPLWATPRIYIFNPFPPYFTMVAAHST